MQEGVLSGLKLQCDGETIRVIVCRKPPDNVSVIQLKISECTNNHDSVEKKKGKSVMFLLGRFSCID